MTNKLSPEAIASLTAVAKENLDELWDEFFACGTWVQQDDLPEVDPSELAESGLIEDKERCEALVKSLSQRIDLSRLAPLRFAL
jgi:hypothetical protein